MSIIKLEITMKTSTTDKIRSLVHSKAPCVCSLAKSLLAAIGASGEGTKAIEINGRLVTIVLSSGEEEKFQCGSRPLALDCC